LISRGKSDKGVLVWTFYDKPYLGAAHGTFGILAMILESFNHICISDFSQQDILLVKSTLDNLLT